MSEGRPAPKPKPVRRRSGVRVTVSRRGVFMLLAGIALLGAVQFYLGRFARGGIDLGIARDAFGAIRRQPFQPLSEFDRTLLAKQREQAQELVRRHVGTRLTGSSEEDLRVLQDLLDREVIAPDRTAELQALGVALGDVMAARFGLDWVSYEDELGRSRALRLGETDVVIFPVTMISKRVEKRVPFRIDELWRKAESTLAESRRGT
jgi:ABC-type multidrug transport system fused ATPase/permease subunit